MKFEPSVFPVEPAFNDSKPESVLLTKFMEL